MDYAYGRFYFEDTDDIRATVTVTMTLKDWEAVRLELGDSSHSASSSIGRLVSLISEMLHRANAAISAGADSETQP